VSDEPLVRGEIDGFAYGDLVLRRVERIEGGTCWRAELSRGGTGSADAFEAGLATVT
jgi:hypothetical protein